MEISTQQIEIFLTVAACGSISHASKQLFISQPALSVKIKQLEDTLGFTLFARTNKGVALTEEGLRLYSALNPVFHRFRVSVDRILSGNDEEDLLRLGCLHMTEVINAMYLTSAACAEKHPFIRMQYEYFNYQELHAKLICRELDAIFTLSYEAEDNSDMCSKRLAPVKSSFLVPESWSINTANELSGRALLLEVNHGRDMLLNQCRAHGFEPSRHVYVSSYLELLNMVRSGDGFTIGGEYLPAVSGHVAGINVIPFDETAGAPETYVSLAWRSGEEKGAVLRLAETASHTSFINWQPAQNYNPAGSHWWY